MIYVLNNCDIIGVKCYVNGIDIKLEVIWVRNWRCMYM